MIRFAILPAAAVLLGAAALLAVGNEAYAIHDTPHDVCTEEFGTASGNRIWLLDQNDDPVDVEVSGTARFAGNSGNVIGNVTSTTTFNCVLYQHSGFGHIDDDDTLDGPSVQMRGKLCHHRAEDYQDCIDALEALLGN